MISRLYVLPKGEDSRTRLFLRAWNGLGLSGKIKEVTVLDSYTINSDLNNDELIESAKTLTNLTLEKFLINQLPKKKYQYVIEIGFLPGVTDNVAHTAREAIADSLPSRDNLELEVYTSKVFLVSGKVNINDVKKIVLSLHNPLIEKGNIFTEKEIKKQNNLPLKIPKVVLPSQKPVIEVSLSVSDDELIKIGKEGISDGNGVRRGPLALDLESMKVIQEYFKKLGRILMISNLNLWLKLGQNIVNIQFLLIRSMK
jgi:phosphoribosylformylglycinamidine synthase